MRVPVALAEAFGEPFEKLLTEFAVRESLFSSPEDLRSSRFLTRSVLPHVEKLSALFNREESLSKSKVPTQTAKGLDPYWKKSSNPAHFRLAYFLAFMPGNLFRVASVLAELQRLGLKWNAGKTLQAIELGAGPAAGACGIAGSEAICPVGLPLKGSFALIEQDKAMLELGSRWAETYFESALHAEWEVRKFHRKLTPSEPLLPRGAPRFNLWVMSFFLNEFTESPEELAQWLLESWERHLDEEGLVILVEPALRVQSRKLLEVRKAILQRIEREKKYADFKLLLPCLGHQACGALAEPTDWCHEEVSWWRPPYLRKLDSLAKLDRKTLPFSYQVWTKSKRSRQELLPLLKVGSPEEKTYRLVSPAHWEGRDQEFFVCGEEGKRRARYRPRKDAPSESPEVGRGDILIGAELRGDAQASRIEKVARFI
jgi:hypothetical protein